MIAEERKLFFSFLTWFFFWLRSRRQDQQWKKRFSGRFRQSVSTVSSMTLQVKDRPLSLTLSTALSGSSSSKGLRYCA